MGTTLVEQLIIKMGLRAGPTITEKTTELLRLLELRSANIPLQINEYGKIVICLDIASTLIGMAFDKKQALKLSFLRKSQYFNNKRMFETLLDLNKIIGVSEICIQLNVNEVTNKSAELLDLFKKVAAIENPDIDITHPQYATMAVFYACKLMKKKVTKAKLMSFSNLRSTQWQQLEQHWDKVLTNHYKDTVNNLKSEHFDSDKSKKKINSELIGINAHKIEFEDYEKWKQRMLDIAKTKMKSMET